MSDHTNLHKHLDYIQATIIRMAANSFLAKGWSVTLVAALFAFTKLDMVFVAIVPVILLWGIDAYYLFQERLFRSLYHDVYSRYGTDDPVALYELSTEKYCNDHSFFGAALTPVTLLFHLALFVSVIAVWITH